MNRVGTTRVGLAFGPASRQIVRDEPELIDYVEVPFEHLRHDPGTIDELGDTSLILHCASMSVAGSVRPRPETLDEIRGWADLVDTPWIGEHLAFTLAHDPGALADGKPHDPTQLTYTMAPQMSPQTVDTAVRNLGTLAEEFAQPIIVENSPEYLVVPGSTMTQTEFMTEIVDRCGVGLLLDLTHLAVSGHNLGFDPLDALERLPLSSIVEVHISGMSVQAGIAWDDHGVLASEAIVESLGHVLDEATPEAVTLEYNWAPDLPLSAIADQVHAVRAMTGSLTHAD